MVRRIEYGLAAAVLLALSAFAVAGSPPNEECGQSDFVANQVVVPRNNAAMTYRVLQDAGLTKLVCDARGEMCTYRFPANCGSPQRVAAELTRNIFYCRGAGPKPATPKLEPRIIGKVFANASMQAVTTRPGSGKLKYRAGVDELFAEQDALRQMGAEVAWAYADPVVGETILTAITDSGVDLDHPDLAARLEKGADFPCQTAECDGRQSGNAHGTSMAGIVAAARYNIGMIGTAWNTRLLPIRLFGTDPSAQEDAVVRAIGFSVERGARVINFSMGSNRPTELIANTLNQSNENFLFVTAAGNQCLPLEQNPIYPASHHIDRMIVVMSHDEEGARVPSSGWGENVDIAAPGEAISAIPCEPANPERCYEMGGSDTSNAAAYVSGAAALLWSAYPHWDWSAIKWRILETADLDDRLRKQMKNPRRLNLARMMNPVSFTHAQDGVISKARVSSIRTNIAFPRKMCACVSNQLVSAGAQPGQALDPEVLRAGDEIRIVATCRPKRGPSSLAYSPVYRVQ